VIVGYVVIPEGWGQAQVVVVQAKHKTIRPVRSPFKRVSNGENATRGWKRRAIVFRPYGAG
jgi:hypothetical protein